MHLLNISRIIRKRNNKKFRVISLLVTGIFVFTVLLRYSDLRFSNSSFDLSADLEYSNELKFDYFIYKILSFEPNIKKPLSTIFNEDDTIRNPTLFTESNLGEYINRGDSIGLKKTDRNNWMDVLNYFNLKNNYLRVSAKMEDKLRDFHTGFLDFLNKDEEFNSVLDLHSEVFEGNGIVIGAGGVHSLMTVSVLHILKHKFNSKLPVEIMIPDVVISKSDQQFCEYVANEFLNVKCIYLRDHFDHKLLKKKYKFKGFQFKSLALLISSFENVLLLDADNYPVKNIDDIFDDKIYKEKGLVVWPDFWRRFTNPIFYESAGIGVDLNEKVRDFVFELKNPIKTNDDEGREINRVMHEYKGTLPDPSSETGQMLFNKKKHFKTLILSLYYNTFGPNIFYHLLSQYSPGQGDKETFIAAAHVLDQINQSPHKSYYQVYSEPSMDGFGTPNGFKAVGYYQKDYRNDVDILKTITSNDKDFALENEGKGLEIREKYLSSDSTNKNALFLHLNFPKFNPLEMTQNNEFFFENRKKYRGITGKKSLGDLDIEKEIITSYKKLLCAENGPMEAVFSMNYKVTKDQVCKYLDKRLAVFKAVAF